MVSVKMSVSDLISDCIMVVIKKFMKNSKFTEPSNTNDQIYQYHRRCFNVHFSEFDATSLRQIFYSL